MIGMKPIQTIPISEIDVADETFSVNFMFDLQPLRYSIETTGLLQPILLRKRRRGYQVVCGFRRMLALKELEHKTVETRVFEGEEMSELKLFTLSLHENLTTRRFNTVEKAVALDKLIYSFGVEPSEVIRFYLPFFSLEPNEKILNTYLSLARMEDEIKTYVVKEGVSRSNIRSLAKMISEDRMALYPVLSGLKLGENRLREMLTLLSEISRREGVNIKTVIKRPEIQEIVSQKELTPIQRTERMKKVLTALRHPRMRHLEEEFEKRRKALGLPQEVSLRHSPYFEGKELKIEFGFETIEEYRAIVETLAKLEDKKEFQEMLHGE